MTTTCTKSSSLFVLLVLFALLLSGCASVPLIQIGRGYNIGVGHPIGLILGLGFMWYCWVEAKRKNRNPWSWLVWSFFFGFIPLVILVYLKDLPPPDISQNEIKEELAAEWEEVEQEILSDNEQKMDIEPASRKRPKLVWVISIYYILIAALVIFSYERIYSGAIPLNEGQKAYFYSLNIFDYILIFATALINVLGAIFLFLLRRYAYHCFITGFTLGIIMTAYHIVFKNWLGALGGSGLVGTLPGWLIMIAIILYSKNLIKKEILK